MGTVSPKMWIYTEINPVVLPPTFSPGCVAVFNSKPFEPVALHSSAPKIISNARIGSPGALVRQIIEAGKSSQYRD